MSTAVAQGNALLGRVARFPGLLLQQLREAADKLMTTLQQHTEPLQDFSEDHQAVAVAALIQLLVSRQLCLLYFHLIQCH